MASKEHLFRRINNTLLDMQASTWQTFEHHFLTLARLLEDPSLDSINQQLVANLDIENFLNESSKTQGSMVGSARLTWPAEADAVLGLKLLLIQKFARHPSELFDFAHTYFTVGRRVDGELHSLTRQLLIPFVRDYKDFVMTKENPDAPNLDTPKISTTEQHITYNISGNNARVNNHSTDNSINTVAINVAISNKIQELRNEIEKTPLTASEKSYATEIVDEVESQIASGKPKKGVVGALLASLPTIDSITTISMALYELLIATGCF